MRKLELTRSSRTPQTSAKPTDPAKCLQLPLSSSVKIPLKIPES